MTTPASDAAATTSSFDLVTEHLTFDQVERLHQETVAPTPIIPPLIPRGRAPIRPPGGAPGLSRGKAEPPVLNDGEIDRLLKALGDDEAYKWIPTYTSANKDDADNAEEADNAAASEEPSVADRLKALESTVGGIETTVATIDDTTVETKEKVDSLGRDIDALRDDISVMKTQLGVIDDLRTDYAKLRAHIATMIRLLTEPGALGAALGINLATDSSKSVASKPPRGRGRPAQPSNFGNVLGGNVSDTTEIKGSEDDS